MKIIIMVLSYRDNGGIYDKFYETQKLTWDSINVENVETYYYFGKNDINSINGKEINVNSIESYTNCTPKTIESFKLIKDKKFDFIFRTNSSSYIDKQLLYNYLLKKDKNKIYEGINGVYTPKNIKFVSGSGYIISKDVFDLIVEKHSEINQNYIDDVALSDFLSKYDILPQEGYRYNIEGVPNQETPLDYYHYRFSNHHINNNIFGMNELHKLKMNNGTNNRK